MSSLPNVSSIYRDLSHIYSSTNYISKSQQTPNYSLQHPNYNNHNNQTAYGIYRNKNEKSAFEDMYDYKQKRHNELMARLKNSREECQGLVVGFGYNIGVTDTGVRNNQYHDKYGTITNTNNIHNQNPINYSNNNNPYQETRSKLTTFAIPKIRYRHIEDQKQKIINDSNNRQRQQNNGIVNNKQRQDINQLQKQFYQDHNPSNKPNHSSISNRNLNQNISKRAQKDTQIIQKQKNSYPQQQFDTKSQLSYTNTMTNKIKNTKYQDKIQSYYQLCRKNVNYKQNQVNNMQKNSKQQKFVRSNNTGRNKAMKLDQAIKLLSLD